MSKIIRANVLVNCPFINEDRYILIDYCEIPILHSNPGYKKSSFRCSDGNHCTCLDDYGACQCYYDAPNDPN